MHVGLPILTKQEEIQIVNTLLEYEQLNFNQAQSIACQLVMDIIKENYHTDMSCVQIEWFYGKFNLKKISNRKLIFALIDFLLNHSEIISKYSHWFNDDIKPILDDSISFKQCQLKNMIQKK